MKKRMLQSPLPAILLRSDWPKPDLATLLWTARVRLIAIARERAVDRVQKKNSLG
jgi:hypothetical protein